METLSELASRVVNLAKIAFKDAVHREGEAIQKPTARILYRFHKKHI